MLWNFNPRSHKGSDLLEGEKRDMLWNFNPRSHKGRDEEMGAIMYSIYISIHAPTRGATQSCKGRNPFFQFQSTLPQGERPIFEFYAIGNSNFNPRSHKGSDLHGRLPEAVPRYFNPRSHKGSDGHSLITSSPWYHFNPRSHKGSDRFRLLRLLPLLISIHAPTRGAMPTRSVWII